MQQRKSFSPQVIFELRGQNTPRVPQLVGYKILKEDDCPVPKHTYPPEARQKLCNEAARVPRAKSIEGSTFLEVRRKKKAS